MARPVRLVTCPDCGKQRVWNGHVGNFVRCASCASRARNRPTSETLSRAHRKRWSEAREPLPAWQDLYPWNLPRLVEHRSEDGE